MFYRTMEIDEILTGKDEPHEILDIMGNNDSHLKLVYLKKKEGFDSHKSNTNVFMYVTDGELEISFPKTSMCGCNICGGQIPDDNDGNDRKYKIKKEQMFMFEKDVEHSLKALKDSKFILVKI